MNSQVWWFVARSSGIIAWALLTLSVCWGLLMSTRLLSRRVRPAWLLDLHRHLGGLAVVFTAIHLVGLVADSYVHFGWAEILVPMASSWKPGAVAFGVVSMYLLIAIEVTSLAMRRLPRSVWRWVHRSSFVLFGFATYHGIVAGTDAGNPLFRYAAWASIAIVTSLTLWLLVTARRTRTDLRTLPVSSDDPVLDDPVLADPVPVSSPPIPIYSAIPGNVRASAAPRTGQLSPIAAIAPIAPIEPFVPEPAPAMSSISASTAIPPPPPPSRPTPSKPDAPVEELISAGAVGEGAGGPPRAAT